MLPLVPTGNSCDPSTVYNIVLIYCSSPSFKFIAWNVLSSLMGTFVDFMNGDAYTQVVCLYTHNAAAAAASLQLCPTLCHPRDGSPPGSPVPGILQARTLEWVAISFSNAWKWKVKVKSLSHVWPSATPWLQPSRLLHPWGFPGKSIGVGCHCLLQHITLVPLKLPNRHYIFWHTQYVQALLGLFTSQPTMQKQQGNQKGAMWQKPFQVLLTAHFPEAVTSYRVVFGT